VHTRLVLPASEYRRSRTAWLAARKAGLGASDTAAVLGVDPWKSPLEVYLDKVDPTVHDDTVSEAAEWGTAVEAVVARKVASRHKKLGKLTPSPGLCAHPDHPWLLATPDRVLVDRATGAEALLEIKTTDGRNKDQWKDGPPTRVQVQVQQQLAVTGLDVAYVAVLFGGREMPAPIRIDRDQTVIDLILEYGHTFWFDHVIARIPPEARLGDDSALAGMYPGDDTLEALIADDTLEALITERRARKADADKATAAVDELDLRIKEALGDRTLVTSVDGAVLATWKPKTSRRVDTRRLKADHPDLVEQYQTTTTTREFRVKETTA
jgi:putative phage-type endonuclease